MRIALCWLAVCLPLTSAAAKFDAASIRPVEAPEHNATTFAGRLLRVTPGRVQADTASLRTVLERAMEIPRSQLIAPPWTRDVYVQITATFPPDAQPEVPAMLRDLLAQRFHLVYHAEDRPTEIVKLERADNLNVALDLPRASQPASPSILPSGDAKTMRIHYVITDTSAALALFLGKEVGRTVVDEVNLPEPHVYAWDSYPLARASESIDPTLPPSVEDLQREVQDQGLRKIGLRLRSAKGQAKHIIVDKLDKQPTEN